jgi:hypothetical protein
MLISDLEENVKKNAPKKDNPEKLLLQIKI